MTDVLVVLFALVAPIAVPTGPTGAKLLGSTIAPEVVSGDAPGGDGGGPVVVVAIVEGDVEVVPLGGEVEDVDWARATLATVSEIAVASAGMPSLSAIGAPR
jgi:hypothetical protein